MAACVGLLGLVCTFQEDTLLGLLCQVVAIWQGVLQVVDGVLQGVPPSLLQQLVLSAPVHGGDIRLLLA